MADRPMTGRSLVSRRAIVDIVRGAVLGSYGVTGVDAGSLERILGRLGLREPGIRVRLDRGLEIDLHLTVAFGLPVAEVARQVDSAVRYAIRRALGREVRRLAVHVGGLRYQPASVPPTKDPAPTKDPSQPSAAAIQGAEPPTLVAEAKDGASDHANGRGGPTTGEAGGRLGVAADGFGSEPAARGAPAPSTARGRGRGGTRRHRDPANGRDPG